MQKNNHELNLTNVDKVYWKEEGYTKGDVIRYYNEISEIILPYLKDRPMVLNRHPNGIDGESFFQKQIDLKHTPSWIQTAEVKHTGKTVTYLLVQDVETLLYVANLGCIELNPFHARVPNLDRPDYMIIDLDPEDVPFDQVVEVALVVHDILDGLNLKNCCKTSGGRGLHIYVPLGARYDFSQSQDIAKMVGQVAQTKLPDLISLQHSPRKRQKRIYVDYLRNAPHQTVAAPYCIRPRPHGPVSTPLMWNEVKPGLNPLDFNIETVPARIKKVSDLFAQAQFNLRLDI